MNLHHSQLSATKVYSALGNHDYHPKSQLPAVQNNIYERTAGMWQDWLEPESQKTFRNGTGFYESLIMSKQLYE